MNRLFTLMVTAIVAGALWSASALAGVLVVDDDGTFNATTDDCNGSVASYTVIQTAINAALAGDTIIVCSGIYAEQLSITKNDLTLVGDGTGLTIIKPGSVSANSTSLFSGAPIAAIILVDGALGVTLSEFTVDGSDAAFDVCAPGYMGIFYRASSGTISGTHVTSVLQPNAPSCQAVLGIFVQSGNGGPELNSKVTITGNEVDHYGKNGITANEAGTSVTVTDNIVTGRGPVDQGDAAQNGIQIGFGARGLVSDNTVTAHDYTPDSWQACGVLFYAGGGGLGRTKTNNYSNNEVDLCTTGAGAPDFDG